MKSTTTTVQSAVAKQSSRPQTSTKPVPAKQQLPSTAKPLATNNKKAILNRLNEDMHNIKSPKNSAKPSEKKINYEYLMNIVNDDQQQHVIKIPQQMRTESALTQDSQEPFNDHE